MASVSQMIAGLNLPFLAEGGFDPLKLNDTSLWLWFLIVFLLTFFLLSKLAWKPLMSTLETREKRISDDIEQAQTARQEAEETLKSHQQKLEESSQHAQKTLDEARARAEKLVEELKAEARAEIQAEREKASREIDAERRSALEGIKEQVVSLSVAINEQLMLQRSQPEDHRAQAEQLMAKLKDLD